jgi:hypothetical protein
VLYLSEIYQGVGEKGLALGTPLSAILPTPLSIQRLKGSILKIIPTSIS